MLSSETGSKNKKATKNGGDFALAFVALVATVFTIVL